MSYKKQYAVDLAIRLVTDQYGDATGVSAPPCTAGPVPLSTTPAPDTAAYKHLASSPRTEPKQAPLPHGAHGRT